MIQPVQANPTAGYGRPVLATTFPQVTAILAREHRRCCPNPAGRSPWSSQSDTITAGQSPTERPA
ncbi:MAG TPA: hypothetical protein VHJ83_07720, partial [Micromonosporaceae bacterium]|nr:hypothetical protein [Micromonosporaceae bacterium]